ncbi:MAG: hypothetical protein JNL08_11970 [Planctomycetes bacterium]|nr:hypothetical protein [Planctomycetota bacterium]
MSAGPTFAQQRLVCIALLLGITFYAVVVGVVLQSTGKGLAAAPLPELDTVAIALGAAMAIGAVTARGVLRRLAERAEPEARAAARFRAVLVPIAMLEGGCLFGITVWMLNGNPVPGLAVAMVLLAIAIVLVPFTDPDAR